MNISCRAAVGLVVFLPAAVPLPAAAQSGQITGVVVDTTGGVLPGVGVTLSGGPDGARHVQTDARGRFAFSGIAPGTYSVTVFLSGFGAATVEGVAVAGELVELPAITLRLVAFDEALVVTAGGRWFGYGIRTGSLTEFPYTPMYNSPFTDFESDDRGVLFKASVSYRFDDRTNVYFTRSEGYRIGGGNNFRVCTDEEIALLSDADPGNDPPQSGCIYEDQALIRPDTTTNYELGLRRSWRDGRFSASGTLFHVDWEDIQVAGLTPFSSEPITLNGGGAALEFLYGYTYIGDVLAPRRVGARIRYTFG